MEYTAEEELAKNIRAMGKELGELYSELWQEVAWAHSKWGEYMQLFGTKKSRVDLLNHAAPRFARLLQDSLWEDALLHIARLTDPAKSNGKCNLSVQTLTPYIMDPDVNIKVQKLVAEAIERADFCRDWRHRRLAHRDLNLALGRGAKPLKTASGNNVRDALEAIAATLNAVAEHYLASTTVFDFETSSGGALSLLYVIDDGLRADSERRVRLNDGNTKPDDFHPRYL